MKKTLITTAVALSALSFAFAQDASGTPPLPPALPPALTTGDQKVDDQVKALRQEMEGKIKALRDEYQKRLKAIIGDRKAMIASTTQEMRKEVKEIRQDKREMMASTTQEMHKEIRDVRGDMRNGRASTTEPQVQGTSTDNRFPKGNAWGFFRRFFGFQNTTTSP